jgi:hypothetical protein
MWIISEQGTAAGRRQCSQETNDLRVCFLGSAPSSACNPCNGDEHSAPRTTPVKHRFASRPCFETGLPAGGTLVVDVFGKTGDGQIPLGFVLNTIDPGWHLFAVPARRVRRRAFMRDRYLNPVGEARKGHIQTRMVFPEVREHFAAGGDDRALQLSDGFVFHTGCIRQVTRRASYGCRQPRISIDL